MTNEEAETINRVAKEVYDIAAEHGFHKGDGTEISMGRMATFCANLHGEASELWEAARHGQLGAPSDKDCGLTCAEEELADLAIRTMDTAVSLGIDIGRCILIKSAYNRGREYMHGKKA